MHRLRDLTTRQRAVAAVLVLLVLVPFGTSLAKALDAQWLPSGDDALIGLRSHDVFTAERPLVGQPSTSHLYGPEEGTAHPGPIEFYWLATPMRVLGPDLGMLVGIAVVNAAAVLAAAFAVFRRAGPVVATWGLVLLGALLWAEGTALLSDPISSNAGGISMVALAALAWAVVDGDHRLLPLATFFGSWVAQQHLAVVAPAAGLVGWALAGVAATAAWRWWRHRQDGHGPVDPIGDLDDDAIWTDPAEGSASEAPEVTDAEPGGAPPRWADRVGPWVLASALLGLVLWLPVIYEEVTGDPGNVSAVLEYAQTSESPSLGWGPAWRQAGRAVGAHPLLAQEAVGGERMIVPLSLLDWVVAVGTYLLLAATAVLARRRLRPLALLAGTALVLAAAGFYNGSTVPASIEAYRINFYRWMFVVSWLAWLAIGWLVLLGAQAALARRPAALPGGVRAALPKAGAAVAAVALVALAVGGIRSDGYNDHRRDEPGFPIMGAASDAAVAAAKGHDRVTLVLRGRSAILASGPALTLQLTMAGHHVVLPDQEARFYGDHRILEPGDDPGGVILQLVTGRGSVPAGPGRVVFHQDMNEELRRVLDPLVAQARGVEPVLSADAEEVLAAHTEPGQREYVRLLLAAIGTDPEPVLTQPTLRAIVADGYFAEPVLDPEGLAELGELPPAATVNDDDVFELRLLTRAELAEVAPSWAAGRRGA